MFEKLQISLWDLLTFVVTGILMIINIQLLVNYGLIDNRCAKILQPGFTTNDFLVGAYYIAFVYLLGAIFEPISNFIFRWLNVVYIKLPWNEKLALANKEIDESYQTKAKEIIEKDYKLKDIKTFEFARDLIIQKDLKTSYMVFLSKFGFYRNLSIFPFLDIILISICDFTWLKLGISLIVGFIFNHMFYIRAKWFYINTGTVIYNNFLSYHSREMK